MSARLFGFEYVHSGARRDRGDNSGSVGFTLAHFRFAEFISVRLGLHGRT